MLEPLELLLLAAAGAVAGFLNVMAGGGSLITLPLLMMLGFPAPLANGTNRLALLAQNIVASTNFRRRGVGDLRTAAILASVALPGAVAGAVLSVRIPDAVFRVILGGILIAAVVATLATPAASPAHTRTRPEMNVATYAAFVGLGIYGGFIQAGAGILFLLIVHHGLRVDLVPVNMYKVFVVGVYMIPALLVFAASGNVDWGTGGILAIGNASGAWLGSHVSVTGGSRAIRVVVAVALAVMAIGLFMQGRT